MKRRAGRLYAGRPFVRLLPCFDHTIDSDHDPMFRYRMLNRSLTPALLTVALLGCNGEPAPEAPAASAARVDSTISRDEALRRFRGDLQPLETVDGATDRDTLVASFVRALATSDTAAASRLMIDRREFAWIFYPTTPQGLPPYDLSPQLMWDLLVRQSDRGLSDAMRRLGGKDLQLLTHDCGAEPSVEGDNRIWSPCTLTLVEANTDTASLRLTGPILEHDGRFKFISLTNDLD